jgi:hypothetical protein
MKNMKTNTTWEEITKLRQELNDSYLEYWLHNNLFSFDWWLILVSIIGISIIWWIFLDKSRIFEILTYGLMIAVIATFFDIIGVNFLLFGYPNSLLPITPSIVPYVTVLPMIYMFLYQTCTNWKWFIIGNVVLAVVFAFVVEPILIWMEIYEYNKWNYFYSFLVYLIMGMSIKWLMTKFKVYM